MVAGIETVMVQFDYCCVLCQNRIIKKVQVTAKSIYKSMYNFNNYNQLTDFKI